MALEIGHRPPQLILFQEHLHQQPHRGRKVIPPRGPQLAERLALARMGRLPVLALARRAAVVGQAAAGAGAGLAGLEAVGADGLEMGQRGEQDERRKCEDDGAWVDAAGRDERAALVGSLADLQPRVGEAHIDGQLMSSPISFCRGAVTFRMKAL